MVFVEDSGLWSPFLAYYRSLYPNVAGFWSCLEVFVYCFLDVSIIPTIHLNAIDLFCMILPFIHLSFRLKSRGLWLQWEAYPAGGWDSRTSCPRFFDLFPGGDAWLMSEGDFDGTLWDFFARCGFQFHPGISLRSFEIEVVSWGHQAPPQWGRKVDEVCLESMGSVWQSRYWLQADRTRTRLLIQELNFFKISIHFDSFPNGFHISKTFDQTLPRSRSLPRHLKASRTQPDHVSSFGFSWEYFVIRIARCFTCLNCCQEQKHISGVTPTEPWELHTARQRTAEGGMWWSSWASNRLSDDLHGIDKTSWCRHCQVLYLPLFNIVIQPIKVKFVSLMHINEFLRMAWRLASGGKHLWSPLQQFGTWVCWWVELLLCRMRRMQFSRCARQMGALFQQQKSLLFQLSTRPESLVSLDRPLRRCPKRRRPMRRF